MFAKMLRFNSAVLINQSMIKSIIYLTTLSSKSTSARLKYEHALNLQFQIDIKQIGTEKKRIIST